MIAIAETAPKQAAAGINHLSWSGLQDYRTCPRRFYYRRIMGAQEETVSASLIFGGAIHRAIERVHEARIEGRKAPKTETLLAEFDAAWKEGIEQGPRVLFAKDDSAESLRETAGRILELYRSYFATQRGKLLAIEHEAVFTLVPDAVPLKARLDLVAVEQGNLVVTDLKTSKCRWSENKTQESLPQLVIYAAAVKGMVKELGLRRIIPRFVVLTKGKSPAIQVVEPTATQDDVVRLKELVCETCDAIKKQVFIRRESWQCNGCPFAGRCLGNGCGA